MTAITDTSDKKTSKGCGARTVGAGVLMLSMSGLLVKAVGMFFKIPLTNMIGESGMGYFGSAYMIYSFFYVISTAGLPLAISILVSGARAQENYAMCRRILSLSLRLFTAVGAVLSLTMLFGARFFAGLISNSGAEYSIAAIAPTVFFVCVISAYRGYFQGFQNMIPTALSQVIEAVGKIVLGLVFASAAQKAGWSAQLVSACAILGITASTALSMISLAVYKRFLKEDKPVASIDVSDKGLIKKLLKLALPISASSAVMSLSGMLDLAIVMRRLQSSGYNEELANALYGGYTSLAVPLFNLPQVFITPVVCAAVPFIAKALASGDRETVNESAGRALKYSVAISLPSSMGLYVFAKPILMLIFNDELAAGAAQSLSLLSLSIVFVAVANVTVSIMQACGLTLVPILTMAAGAIVKLFSAWFLIGEFGINGTPLSTLACYFTITAVNLIILELGLRIKCPILKDLAKPLLCALISIGGAYALWLTVSERVGIIACPILIAAAATVYFIMLMLTGHISREEAADMPMIGRLISKITDVAERRKNRSGKRRKGDRTRQKERI